MNLRKSANLIARAERSIPGGVNSPVRAFKGVGGTPVFFASGEGAWLTDVDGNAYIDFVGSWGPMLQGHAFGPVIDAVRARAERGLGFGAPSEIEVDLAEAVVARFPAIEKVRMVNSGTEATMTAIRLARGYTGRDLIVKFQGCYHGHSDALLARSRIGSPYPWTAQFSGGAGRHRETHPDAALQRCERRCRRVRALPQGHRRGHRGTRRRATWAACHRSRSSSSRCGP